jgi:membrane fusion protein, multidrug efflux system
VNADQHLKVPPGQEPPLHDPKMKDSMRGQESTHAAPLREAVAAGVGIGLLGRVVRLSLQALLPLAVLAAAVAGYNYLKATKVELEKQAPRETSYAVRTVTAAFGPVTPMLVLYGVTTAGRQVEMRSLVSGRVVETGDGLRDGGIVSKGDILLKIDPFDFKIRLDEARAQAAEAKARLAEMQASLAMEKDTLSFARRQLQLAQSDLDRAKPLAQRGAVSDRTVDERQLLVVQRQQSVTLSENNIAIWTARVDQQKAVTSRLETAIAQAERRLKETTLEAPFDAYVSGIGAQVGRMVSANDSVATLIDRNWLEAKFTLTNEQYGRLVGAPDGLEGRPVELTWKVGDRTLRYPATIERVGARVTANTGGVDIHARLRDPSQPVPLRPGVFVEVVLEDALFENVAKVPSSAVYDSNRVYVVESGRLKARAVTVAGSSGADLLVTGELKAGELVVTTRLSAPGDGVRVELIKSDAGGGNGA